MSQRVLKVGLVRGGGGAFIVNPHQKAFHFDGPPAPAPSATPPTASRASMASFTPGKPDSQGEIANP